MCRLSSFVLQRELCTDIFSPAWWRCKRGSKLCSPYKKKNQQHYWESPKRTTELRNVFFFGNEITEIWKQKIAIHFFLEEIRDFGKFDFEAGEAWKFVFSARSAESINFAAERAQKSKFVIECFWAWILQQN